MAIINKTVTIAIGETKLLHRTFALRFSVEIISGRDLVRMQRVRFGVVGSGFIDTNFLFVKTGEAIPTAAIMATPNSAQAITITFKVRSGRDFTGTPEL